MHLAAQQEEDKNIIDSKIQELSSENSTDNSNQFTVGGAYKLAGITVEGLQKYQKQAFILSSGLEIGSEIKLPGDKLSSAIKKLYNTNSFGDVAIFLEEIIGRDAYLHFVVEELPKINKVAIKDTREKKAKKLLKEAELIKGSVLTDNLLITAKNYLEKKYKEKGFLNTQVQIATKPDDSLKNSVNMELNINKGKKVKISSINFAGNNKISDVTLRKSLKKTKKKFFGRFWKGSKYIEENFKEDQENLLNTYRKNGFRDAQIVDYKLAKKQDNTLGIDLEIQEGSKYVFGDVNFIGNKKYTDAQLQKIIGIEKGDIYNGDILTKKVTGDGSPNSRDITSIYQNNGYLFSRVVPVETSVNKDSINVEIRIFEDEPTRVGKITVNGNDKTNDHVIYRALRTKPGYLYSKGAIINSIRELGQLGFFDPESITPDLKPNYIDKTVDIDYTVAEKGSSQIELQGGYGGGTFVGTLGLTFNNFSARNIFNKKAYNPLPMGDGQSLSLRLQQSRAFTTSSFSFVEPWLGGVKPKALSFSIYNSQQFLIDSSNEVDRDQSINIIGSSIGISQRLKWPDNYFYLSQSINYKLFDLNNYNVSTFNFSNGQSHNLSYNVSFSRRSSGPNPIFPKTGSEFSVSGRLTFPYSAVNGVDYSDPALEDQDRYKFLEYYKLGFKARWFTPLIDKFVLMTNTEFGFLGSYNKNLQDSPFERYFVGGEGIANNQLDGRENIRLRGYENNQLSSIDGDRAYNKFEMELRYPITLKPAASIYTVGFIEAGNSFNDLSKFNPFNLKRSAGFGIRLFMPAFGLLGFDFAHGFDPLPGETQKSGWQTHFYIGQQF
jgi:outer membrane protein insertion porin family